MPNKELKEIESAIEALKVRDRMTGGLLVSNQVALSCMELVKEILDDKILLNEVKELGFNIEHRYQQIRKSK